MQTEGGIQVPGGTRRRRGMIQNALRFLGGAMSVAGFVLRVLAIVLVYLLAMLHAIIARIFGVGVHDTGRELVGEEPLEATASDGDGRSSLSSRRQAASPTRPPEKSWPPPLPSPKVADSSRPKLPRLPTLMEKSFPPALPYAMLADEDGRSVVEPANATERKLPLLPPQRQSSSAFALSISGDNASPPRDMQCFPSRLPLAPELPPPPVSYGSTLPSLSLTDAVIPKLAPLRLSSATTVTPELPPPPATLGSSDRFPAPSAPSAPPPSPVASSACTPARRALPPLAPRSPRDFPSPVSLPPPPPMTDSKYQFSPLPEADDFCFFPPPKAQLPPHELATRVGHLVKYFENADRDEHRSTGDADGPLTKTNFRPTSEELDHAISIVETPLSSPCMQIMHDAYVGGVGPPPLRLTATVSRLDGLREGEGEDAPRVVWDEGERRVSSWSSSEWGSGRGEELSRSTLPAEKSDICDCVGLKVEDKVEEFKFCNNVLFVSQWQRC